MNWQWLAISAQDVGGAGAELEQGQRKHSRAREASCELGGFLNASLPDQNNPLKLPRQKQILENVFVIHQGRKGTYYNCCIYLFVCCVSFVFSF